MIRLPSAIYALTEPVNLHLSFDRLAGLVRELGGDPRSDALYMFHNRRRTHLKLLWHDPRGLGGYVILYKRLDRGVYRIPLAIPKGAQQVVVSRRELEVLLEGIDSAMLRAARRSVRTRGAAESRRGVDATR